MAFMESLRALDSPWNFFRQYIIEDGKIWCKFPVATQFYIAAGNSSTWEVPKVVPDHNFKVLLT